MKMGVGALIARHFDDRIGVRFHDRLPVPFEMLEPTAVPWVMSALLNLAIKIRRAAQRLLVPARPVVLDQRVNDKGFAVENFAVVENFAGEVGGPEVTAIFLIQEMVDQKPIAVLRGLEVIPFVIGVPLLVHAGER